MVPPCVTGHVGLLADTLACPHTLMMASLVWQLRSHQGTFPEPSHPLGVHSPSPVVAGGQEGGYI